MRHDFDGASNLREIFPSHFPYLETAFLKVSEENELTEAKHGLAKQRYETISEHFDSTPQETALGQLKLKMYPHGGFALGTAKKPFGRNEFDLDMTCEVHIDWNNIRDPRSVKDALKERFDFNEVYRKLLEVKTRVLRLNYAGDFHLDFMPAVPFQLESSDTTILIPHKVTETLYEWKISNPLGFKFWFEKRCELRMIKNAMLSERTDNEILPFPIPEKNKAVLKIVVILLKQARDVFFESHDSKDSKAASSIVLTTLAALNYRGESEVSEAFINIVNSIYFKYYIDNAPKITNPVNDKEDFAEELRQNQKLLKLFQAFLYDLYNKTQDLLKEGAGLDIFEERLGKLFGKQSSKKAVEDIATRTLSSTRKGLVGVTSFGGLTLLTKESAAKVVPHKFHGDF